MNCAQKTLVFLFIFLFLIPNHLCAQQADLSLELQNASLPDTLRLLAKFLKINVMISPSIDGTVTLHLHNARPAHALNALLVSHHLGKWCLGNVWLIAPKEELIKRKEEELKWQEINEQSSTLITKVWQIKYAKAADIARLLQDDHSSMVSKRGRISIDQRTNVIYIHDVAEKIANVDALIKRLDVPVKQILIEARLASVDSDFERELGINFGIRPTEENNKNPGRSLVEQVSGYSLAIAKLADGSLLDVRLSALENAGHAELISRPSLFTDNQQTASIEAGEEVPYQEVSESGGTAVVFKKAVLGLKVTPHILPGNKVLLQLQINQDRPSSRMVLGVPTISTRQIITNVLLKMGQTVVLGGIYESNHEIGNKGIPFLNQIPLLGILFRQQATSENKRELLIFVTPKSIT